MSTEETDGRVPGERHVTAVSQAASMQSRVSNFLALGLMSVVGLGMLTWYYANAWSRQGRAREAAQSQTSKRAAGDLPLPSIGRIDAPPRSAAPLADPAPLREVQWDAVPMRPAVAAAPAPKSAEELELERRLAGAAFAVQGSVAGSNPAPSPTVGAADSAAVTPLDAMLRASKTTIMRAEVLPTQRLLLPKGAFIDCTLETAIDSTLPGMTTCVMATDTFGVDGKVVLLERGTKLVGETRGEVSQGAARVFVLWSEARTPAGVVVPLASPSADELGRAGLPGDVNRHFWQRFGAAMLVSLIDGVMQGAVGSGRGSGNVVVNPAATQDVMTEVLKNTISIPPTVRKRQGDRIQVLVARDLDFRSVYELRSARVER